MTKQYLPGCIILPLSCEEFNPYYDSVGDWAAHLGGEVAGLGEAFWNNQGYWYDRVLNPNDTFDWFYSSANWWTMGTIDSFARANDARWNAMLSDPSLYTITNYLTLGTTEAFGRAISPGSYDVKFFSLEHIASFGNVILIGYTAGKGYQATHIDPYSTAGLQQISGLPENVAISQGAMADQLKQGQLIGDPSILTPLERPVVEDLISQGHTVELIPRSATAKTADFMIDGVVTELKTLTGSSLNTAVTRIQDAFRQSSQAVIIDARLTGMTEIETIHVLERAAGSFGGALPGSVEIWTVQGIIRG